MSSQQSVILGEGERRVHFSQNVQDEPESKALAVKYPEVLLYLDKRQAKHAVVTPEILKPKK
jgi:hypothetical protein